jgi:hypothetical protein
VLKSAGGVYQLEIDTTAPTRSSVAAARITKLPWPGPSKAAKARPRDDVAIQVIQLYFDRVLAREHDHYRERITPGDIRW